VALCALALTFAAGCGIQPTDVIDAGEPATGLTKALRIYYVREDRLEGVTRPEMEVHGFTEILKLMANDPTPAEQERGLTNLLTEQVQQGGYGMSGSGTRITLTSRDDAFSGVRTRLANGQWVCTLARAQAVLDPSVRPDDVQVTLKGAGAPLGPYQCSDFLGRG
jgi:hypothetical protein